jgi:hypothetical protein
MQFREQKWLAGDAVLIDLSPRKFPVNRANCSKSAPTLLNFDALRQL